MCHFHHVDFNKAVNSDCKKLDYGYVQATEYRMEGKSTDSHTCSEHLVSQTEKKS